MRARWFAWLFKPLVAVLLVPILGCGSLVGLLLLDTAIRRIPANVIRVVREQGNLAPLPRSATDIRTDGWSTGFSSARYIRFEAKPEEIEQFLADSPGLKGARPERLNPQHRYLPYPPSSPRTDEEMKECLRDGHFSLNGPPWYNPTIRTRGRLYAIPWHDEGYHGQVVIDDEHHVVCIEVSYS